MLHKFARPFVLLGVRLVNLLDQQRGVEVVGAGVPARPHHALLFKTAAVEGVHGEAEEQHGLLRAKHTNSHPSGRRHAPSNAEQRRHSARPAHPRCVHVSRKRERERESERARERERDSKRDGERRREQGREQARKRARGSNLRSESARGRSEEGY